jgi:hypothetical protein
MTWEQSQSIEVWSFGVSRPGTVNSFSVGVPTPFNSPENWYMMFSHRAGALPFFMNQILHESDRASREKVDHVVVPPAEYAVAPRGLQNVARGLDDISQQLFGVIFMAKALERQAAHKNLPWTREARQIQSLIHGVIRQTDQLVQEFQRLSLPADALEAHLKKRAAKARKHRLRIGLSLRPVAPKPSLPGRNGHVLMMLG